MLRRRDLLRMLLSSPLGVWFRPCIAEVVNGPVRSDAADHYRRAFAWLANLTEKDKVLLGECRRVPLDGAVEELLRRATPALSLFRQGAAIPGCAWDEVVTLKALGREHLDVLNLRIQKLAILRARSHWKHDQSREALEDLFATVKFGRHIGGAGVFIARVFQCTVENDAIAVIAENLPRLDAPKLDGLPARINALPPSTTWAQTMEAESRFIMAIARAHVEGLATPITVEALDDDVFSGAEAEALLKQTGGDRLRLLDVVKDVRPRLMELAEVLSLPSGRYKPNLEAFVRRVEVPNPIATSVVRNAESLKFAIDRTEALWSMLRAAIAMIRGGQERFREVADPFGDGPFGYRPRDGGFDLQSALQFEERPPVLLVVGGSSPPSALPLP